MASVFDGEVESSAISDLAYDEDRSELYIRFRGGGAYTYLEVPMDEYLALCEADSKGKFVNEVIKRKYDFRAGAPI